MWGIWIMGLLATGAARAEPERHLPRGEETPHVIEKVFASPVGEVQFTQFGKDGHSGFLRNAKGALMAFQEVRGPALCEDWFQSTKWAEIPRSCEFVFFDDYTGKVLGVRGEEMTETDLFENMSGKLRRLPTGTGTADRGLRTQNGRPHVPL